ncbi:Creatinase/aminopeptidase [Yamadazyma tenuis ATCC 10573]|uniref:Creatinase/aminopeptidase n=2 Tax=Candida tenuis TaxID=2315449 RepID=G3B5W5_CANTC|nr:Creatinase/aminopeptidase [Yamadazyma tenuis ATCC 10573]EGV63321.1 Creatinase/aminopeptidase [Yamadazyma tenuis ATCC 10573]
MTASASHNASHDRYHDYESDLESDTDSEILPDLPYSASLTYNFQSKSSNTEKLQKLRGLMKQHGISVYIVPSEDEHQSEYTALADKRREFISEFTGSAGIAVITLDDGETLTGQAAMSTDGRYFLQAEKQLNKENWTLLKQGNPSYPKWTQWCIDKAIQSKFSNVISCDPRVISLSTGEFFEKASKSQYSGQIKFEPLLKTNLIDEVWGDEKPSRSLEPVFVYEMEFAGETVESKLKRVRKKMSEDGNGTHLLVTALDEVAWLLNLRCTADVEFNACFFSYVIVTLDGLSLYIDERKLSDPKVKTHLDQIKGLVVKKYGSFYDDLKNFKSTINYPEMALILPSKTATTYAILASLPQSLIKQRVSYNPIVSYMKLYKNETELKNAEVTQYKDSLALIIFSAWLEHSLLDKKMVINEYEAACKIHQIKTRFPNFLGESYETISSSGPNGAIIHYAPSKEENSIIDPEQIYLLDVGSQFLEGTTDITRTYKFGYEGLLEEDRKFYTLVLKAHLAVALAKFPPNNPLTSAILDSYSRQPLWNEGLDFNHGSGHGVGVCGNVHEGPLYLSTTNGGPSNQSLFAPGAITTIEPGYYVDGVKGFRVESEIQVIECEDTVGRTREGNKFLCFKYLTPVPFCHKLIDTKYLSRVEIDWINEFHRSIRLGLGKQLLEMGEFRAYKWLVNETRPI